MASAGDLGLARFSSGHRKGDVDEVDDRERDLWEGGERMRQSQAPESEEVSAQVALVASGPIH